MIDASGRQYRVVTNGTKFRVQRRQRAWYLAWTAKRWANYCMSMDGDEWRFGYCNAEFDSRDKAEEVMAELIGYSREARMTWEPVEEKAGD